MFWPRISVMGRRGRVALLKTLKAIRERGDLREKLIGEEREEIWK